MPHPLSPTTSISSAAMRWPCFSRPRAGGPASDPPRPGSSSSSDTPHDKLTDPPRYNEPGLARLFSDAASFGRILTSRSDLVEEGSVAGDSSRGVHDTLQGFSRLVARDLDSSELAVSEKLAQLSVSNWDSAGSTTLAPDVDLGESEDSASDDEHDRALPCGGATQAAGESDFEDRLTPDEILDLLQQEFGALAPPGEEKLLLETDASLMHDVVILVCLCCKMVQLECLRLTQGVVHLTTHRLTFHASLLSSQDDRNEGVLKSGAILVHRKGLHRKKRVWLRLTKDMLSTYPSSRDEDKIKPIRTILCK